MSGRGKIALRTNPWRFVDGSNLIYIIRRVICLYRHGRPWSLYMNAARYVIVVYASVTFPRPDKRFRVYILRILDSTSSASCD